MNARPVVIGVGNPWRRDDGVGHIVAIAASHRLADAVDVVRCEGEPTRLLDAWRRRPLAVVVDAVRSGAPPGTVHRWTDASRGIAPPRTSGSHAMGVADAIALGRALDQLPERLVVIGIEAGDTSDGEGLSASVAASVDKAVDAVVESCRAFRFVSAP